MGLNPVAPWAHAETHPGAGGVVQADVRAALVEVASPGVASGRAEVGAECTKEEQDPGEWAAARSAQAMPMSATDARRVGLNLPPCP